MNQLLSLDTKLKTIKNIFDIKNIINIKTDQTYIQKYYKVNRIPYSIFHSNKDFVHMGISRSGTYNKNDLLEQPRIVEKYIKILNGKGNILELATGRGANSVYLAKKYPLASFHGIDISKGQLDYAFKKAKNNVNYFPAFCDFHDLSDFNNETFDIIFIIEALCHSTDKNKVLNEANRVLKKGGVFIIIDGYAKKDLKQCDYNIEIAARLLEKSMAVEKFELYEKLVEQARKNNFKIISEEDVSQFIIPTLEQLENKAKKFFKHTFLAKLFLRVAPKEFLYNAIAGYLFPDLIKLDVFNYRITILKKNDY